MKNNFIVYTCLLLLIVGITQLKAAESFSVLCTPIEEGVKIDFQKESKDFSAKSDKMSFNTFNVHFDLSGDTEITVTFIPIVEGKNAGMEEEKYSADLIHYSEHLMVVKFNLLQGIDKFQMIAISLDQRLAYLISTAAYMGYPNGKMLADTNPAIPEASASIFPMAAKMIRE